MGLNLMRIEDKIRPAAKIKAAADRIVFSTEARGLISHARAVEEDRKAREAARAAEIAAVVAQPHRRGSYDPKRESALGRFCDDFKPFPLGDHCYRAGVRYAEIIGEAKTAQGFPVPGYEPPERGYWEQCAKPNCDKRDPRSSVCLCSAQARKELALMRLRDADAILAAIFPGLPWQMYRLCFNSLDPAPQESDPLRRGLTALSDAWGFTPKSAMRP